MTAKSILIVEDEAVVALHLTEIVSNAGYSVLGMFASGEEALIFLNNSVLPDAVIMDIGLAGTMNGIETACQLKKMYGVPIIFLTAYSDEERIKEAMVVDPSAYLFKPIIPDNLLFILEKILGPGTRE